MCGFANWLKNKFQKKMAPLKKKKKDYFLALKVRTFTKICGTLGKAKFDVIVSKVTTSTASNFFKNWITK